jgi:hypothetical protein
MARPEWEYCSLSRFPRRPESTDYVHQFTIFGEPPGEPVRQREEGEQAAWQQKIADLGHEGWEMMYITQLDGGTTLHFKRMIEAPQSPPEWKDIPGAGSFFRE